MSFFAAAVATIVSVVDPVAVAPLFLAVTPGMDRGQRLSVMGRSVVIAAVILIVFAFAGRFLLRGLGITVPAFSMAGGILLLLIAIDMLFARTSRTKETPEEGMEALRSTDVSVFPLAVPILAGPGAIATVILYMSEAGTDVGQIVAVLAAIAIALIASYLTMRLSALLLLLLRETGVNVISRVMGILLAALAVQFILNGINTYYHHTLSH
jgi:multiple antibiotic resistance protein